MTNDSLFSLANLCVLPFWLLLIVVPRFTWAVKIVRSPLIAIVPAGIYLVALAPMLLGSGPGSGASLFSSFGTLPGVMTLMANPSGALAVWVHILAFDLLTARWAYLEAHERGIAAWIMAPILLCVFLLGPLGFALYLIVRAGHGTRDVRR